MPNPTAPRPATALRLAWLLSLLLCLMVAAPLRAEIGDPGDFDAAAGAEPVAEASAAAAGRLPAASTTRHELPLGDRPLHFTATAGSLTLLDNRNRPEADIAFVAYLRESDDPARRPVTFAVNGGPGAASAYLHIGVIGPWLLPMEGESIAPSQPVDLVPNADTWLEFTDLVFIDPVGTGFSRLVSPNDRLRGRYLSVEGDADAIAEFIDRWLVRNDRTASPKYFVGESYGGFRGPLIAERLQRDHGVGLSGMILVSPVLDFGWWQQPSYAPLPHVSLLPSLAAAGMEAAGDFSEDHLRAAEQYAAGDYVTDLLRGLEDAAAVARTVDRIAAITGLPRETVARHAGRVDARSFVRELLRGDSRIASVYDTTITGGDPAPEQPFARGSEPVLDAMTAPLTSAMIGLYRDTLEWLPDRRYQLLNRGVSRAWNWGGGRGQPEAVSALRRVLALDPSFRLLVTHGYTDLVTPYFASELILRQINADAPDRVHQANYRGGHMFYTRPESRRAFRSDALRLYQAEAG